MIRIAIAVHALAFALMTDLTDSEAQGDWKTAKLDTGYTIYFKQDTKQPLLQLLKGKKKSHVGVQSAEEAAERLEVIEKVEKMARDSQQEVITMIEQHPIKHQYDSIWITNQIFLKTCDLRLLKKLMAAGGISKLVPTNITHRTFHRPAGTKKMGKYDKHEPRNTSGDIQWNIQKICAPPGWEIGWDGRGIRLGFINEGVKGNHDLLQGKWTYTEFGWYDATGQNTAFPNDDVYYLGHGTMRVGEAMADGGYGTAPGSRYIACRACLGAGCIESAYYKCVEFMICPWDRSGNKDCRQAPHAVNIGLINYRDEWDFNHTINAMNEAGILVVTEADYWPPPLDIMKICGTVRPPCAHEKALCVGAAEQSRRYPYTRCGPAKENQALIKPDVLAPGHGYYGCFTCPPNQHQRGDCYQYNHGYTSGAGHIMGLIAILLSRRPTTGLDQLKRAIRDSTDDIANDGAESVHECGGKKDDPRPNFIKGYGFVNACTALEYIACREENSTSLMPKAKEEKIQQITKASQKEKDDEQ